MENNQEVVQTNIGEWLDKDTIFYRPEDKTCFLEAINAILHKNQGAVILSKNEAILDYYSRLMVSRLRKIQNFDLEVLLPSTTESLLKRFNRIMSKMSLDDALRPAKADSAVTLMIVNDAHLIDQQQWALVSQLIGDFPGVNVRLVAFINSNEHIEYDQTLNLFQEHLFRWILDQPSLQEIDALKLVTSNTKFADAATQLLSEFSFEETNGESYEPAEGFSLTDSVEDELVDKNVGIEDLEDNVDLTSMILEERSAGMSNRFSFLAPACLLLMGAVIIFFGLNPDHAEYLLDQASNSDSIHPEVEVGAKTEPNISNALQAAPANKVTPVLSVVASKSLKVSKPAPSKVIINADPESYFIQFNLFKERITAEEYRGENDALATAMLVDIKRDKEQIYGIISGPFDTKEKAEKFVSVPGMPKNYWIRTAQTLQAVITNG
jgi:hypothetical protein